MVGPKHVSNPAQRRVNHIYFMILSLSFSLYLSLSFSLYLSLSFSLYLSLSLQHLLFSGREFETELYLTLIQVRVP